MGKVLSVIKNPFRNFNVESRAHKVIGQSKPIPAPRHAKDEQDIKRIKDTYPEVFEEGLKKNEQLDKHLRDVFVISHDAPPKLKQQENPQRPLPKDRSQPEMFLFGHKEPDKVPFGKTLLKDALQFISKHQSEPNVYTAARIAEEYKLSEEIVANILKYHRVFEIYVPEQQTSKAKFAGPSLPNYYTLKEIKQLTPGDDFKKKNDDT